MPGFVELSSLEWHERPRDDGEVCVAYLRGGPWTVEVGFRVRSGSMVSSRMCITVDSDSDESIKADLLRSIKVGAIHAEVMADAAARWEKLDKTADEAFDRAKAILEQPKVSHDDIELGLAFVRLARRSDADMRDLPLPAPPERRPGQRLSEAHFAYVAVRYLVLSQTVDRGIIAALADDLTDLNGGHRPSNTVVKSWIAGATRRSFLSAGRRGQVGRTPGKQLKPFIERFQQEHEENDE